jgi:2-polyprenyl-3-methyl-5-hydroxy-6-metoxy-1,4-benzoquinol methylase
MKTNSLGFTSHNILLNNKKKTLGEGKILLSDSLVLKTIKKVIDTFIHTSPDVLNNMTAVDLGCMEGGYSLELARMGFNTLGIDARKEHIVKASYVKFNTLPGKLNFVLDDVRNLPKYGTFDVTFCFGLLYHLDKPAAFLKTIYEHTNSVLILHTFYAPDAEAGHYFKRVFQTLFLSIFKKKYNKYLEKKYISANNVSYLQHIKGTRLSGLTVNEGYRGRWYREWKKDASREKIESKRPASYNNHQSFWLCKKDMIKALYDAGFSSVYEQLDDIGDLASIYPSKYYGRTLLIAVK